MGCWHVPCHGSTLLSPPRHLSGLDSTAEDIHAMLMIFFIMPGVMSGLGNLLLPVQLGVPELLFPKVNNLGTQQATSPGRGDAQHLRSEGQQQAAVLAVLALRSSRQQEVSCCPPPGTMAHSILLLLLYPLGLDNGKQVVTWPPVPATATVAGSAALHAYPLAT